MPVPAGDAQLIQIMDSALADAAKRAGAWLACRPGCTQCCYGAFAINALDAARLRTGIGVLRTTDPEALRALEERVASWLAEFGPDFPGDSVTGLLGVSDEEQARFDDFANDAPCPALNPATGLCDVYAWRPMTCRVFGPPTRMDQGDVLGCCELCFVGAKESEIAACEMPVPQELEAQLLAEQIEMETGRAGETIVAFALRR